MNGGFGGEQGVRWMVYNWLQGRGSILADEMGLGKTLQVRVSPLDWSIIQHMCLVSMTRGWCRCFLGSFCPCFGFLFIVVSIFGRGFVSSLCHFFGCFVSIRVHVCVLGPFVLGVFLCPCLCLGMVYVYMSV